MDIQTILLNLKIDQLNAMQEASIDAWKEGSDLILLSPTGSGKTLAYLLPLVSSLKKGVEGVQAVVLVPSRGHFAGGNYRYSGTYERPPEQAEFRGGHRAYAGHR